MTGIGDNVARTRERIHNAARRAGRNSDAIQLLAVTKTVSSDRVLEAVECGITHIAENRLQEALTKRDALAGDNLTWHFIGHLQTNKAKRVVETFDIVHSVDRLELAEALAKHVGDRSPLPVLIEVKLEDEVNKSGVAESDLAALAGAIRQLSSLNLRGLMAIPPPAEDPQSSRPYFRRLRLLAEQLQLPDLSMGMTHDFEEGATMVRVGTGLFGSRA